jgi:hypothetical protein
MRTSFSVWVSVVATANGDGQSQSHVGILPTCRPMPTAFESIKAIEGKATIWERMFNSKATREQKAADRVEAAILKFQRKPLDLNRTRFKVGDSDGIVDKWKSFADKYNEILAEVYNSDMIDGGWRIAATHRGCDSSESDRKSKAVFQLLPDKSDSVDLSSTFLAAKCSASCRDIPHNVMIKYTNTCHDEAGLDALVSEYAIIRSLETLDVAPKVFSLSAPAVPSASDWSWDNRLRSRYVELNKASCAKRRSSVRGLVMERYTDLDGVFRQGQVRDTKIKLVIDYAIETILRLRELHDAGFIHGGINAETVALRDSDSRTVLVDFSHARFYPSEIGGVDKVAHAIGQLDLISKLNESYWSMMGFRIGRRDDLYRVIEMIAYLLTPTKHEFFDALLSLSSSKKSMAEVKSTASFFSMKYPHKSLCELNASKDKMPQCDNAMLELKKVLAIVRRISSVDTEPNYRSIIEGLEAAREALGS